MVTSSIPALPRFFFTFSQARSKFFRLNTLSISEWTFFLPCLFLDVCEVRCSAVSSALLLGLSRKELSNHPGPFAASSRFPHAAQHVAFPLRQAFWAKQRRYTRQRSEALCSGLVDE